MLAGNFAGPAHETATSEPTPEQLTSLGELCDYLMKAFGMTNQDLFGHYHFGKAACPGYVVEEWVERRRKGK
jgi:hypothetical protein